MKNYSILMSIYANEDPNHLKASVDSMLNQSYKTNDFVIVCDGPLNNKLNNIIEYFTLNFPDVFNIVRLEKNIGTGGATDIGLRNCKNEYIAKMDADDISTPNRCKQEVEFLDLNSDITIVGGNIKEFIDDVNNIVGTRNLPSNHEDIIKFAKRRNPFNNVTIMFRKSHVVDSGGYSNLRRVEDYEMVARVLNNGYKGHNINQVFAFVRLDSDAYKRRGNWSNVKSFISVRWKIYKTGFSGFFDFLIPTIGQLIIAISPEFLKRKIYDSIIRKG